MRFALLFVVLCVAGGLGGSAGSMLGNLLGTGGALAGGVAGGVALVIAGSYLAARLGWIESSQRGWTIVGALLGFGAAALVTLSTLYAAGGALASTLLVGIGGTMGSLIGRSTHGRAAARP